MTKDGERHLRAVHEDWGAVATAVNARMANRRTSQQELALAAGVSVATLRVLQRGNGDRRVQNATLAAVSRALGWPDDHLVRLLLGDQYPGPTASRRRPRTEPPVRTTRGPAGSGRTTPRVRVARQPAITPSPDLPEQILLTLRRIERGVDAIARHLVRT
jgi:DNA-binding Xre family transcriptional regulator